MFAVGRQVADAIKKNYSLKYKIMNTENKFQNSTSEDQNKSLSGETNKNTIEVLNSLMQINNDRIEGYGHAAKEIEDETLVILFNEMAAKSRVLKRQLADEVLKYGGQPTDSTTVSGKVFRAWMDFKSVLTGKNRDAILASCVFGEDAAQETYANAIKKDSKLPSSIIELISKQKAQLSYDQNRVKSYRD